MTPEPFTEAWLCGPKSTQFYTRTYPTPSSPAKAHVVFVHGFIEHITRYERTHVLWASRGVSVFAFDQRGFGRTAQDEKGKSKDSAYGKTSWRDNLADIEWAIKHVKAEAGDRPVFLMGHSMGGALALSFVTRTGPPPETETCSILAGVIATSPLIQQAIPVLKISRWAGGQAAKVLPYTLIPAAVNADDISHDKAVNEAYVNDPLIVQKGSLRGIGDMLNGGDEVLSTGYKHWPPRLPLLLVHGTADKVTSCKASQTFYEKIPATDKTLSLYEGGYHELHNEPDGVKEKLMEECLAWIEAQLHKAGTSKL